MSRSIPYFAYGSNMSRLRLEARIGSVVVLGGWRAEGFVHRFNKLGADGTAKGNIVPAPGSVVHGVLFGLLPPQLESLRRYEGGYLERPIGVVRGEEALRAITFVACAPRDELPPPSDEYLAHYRRGAAQHGLPKEYLATILDESIQ